MSRMFGITLIFLGIIISLSGVWIVSQSPSGGAIASVAVEEPVTAAIIPPSIVQKDVVVSPPKTKSENRKVRGKAAPKEKDTPTKLDNEKAGLDFEKYIVKKFDRKYFKLLKWAGDKFVDGIFDESNLDPDLQLELTVGGKKYSLAVECKWRSSYRNDFVMFANDSQLERYQAFEEENGFPVFIALGFGRYPFIT